jgi:hypothetical protein
MQDATFTDSSDWDDTEEDEDSVSNSVSSEKSKAPTTVEAISITENTSVKPI